MRASSRDCRAYGKKNEATLSATTLGVVEIAPHVSASNKLGINQSNGSNLLGKNASIVAWLPCLWQEIEITSCGRTNLNYTSSSTQVLSQGLQRTSNGVTPWPVG
jgi:hypothetical protein